MALPIAPIPVLYGRTAEKFLERLEKRKHLSGTIDCTEQLKRMRAILAKANI